MLLVVDASDASFEEQLAVTRGVLAEIGASDVPLRLVMNKMDRLDPGARQEIVAKFPDAWFISAKSASDVASVWEKVVAFFESSYATAEFVVPYARQAMVSEFHESGRVDEARYEDDGVHITFRADAETIDRLGKKLS